MTLRDVLFCLFQDLLRIRGGPLEITGGGGGKNFSVDEFFF